MIENPWGNKQTQFFFALLPNLILDNLERAFSVRCTGRVLALNSMENRVYEVELDLDGETNQYQELGVNGSFVVAKFYRPGRWSEAQIQEEHDFLFELSDNEIPVVAPLKATESGKSVFTCPETGLFFAAFPKRGGRLASELNDDEIKQVGRLLARIHQIGRLRPAPSRLRLDVTNYGWENLKYLIEAELIPVEVRDSYSQTVGAILSLIEPWFKDAQVQRIHGDAHLGNLIHGREGFCWVDFDDMVIGPPVQDLWLIVPGRDEFGKAKLHTLIESYQSMNDFDLRSLRLIEALRTLRYLHFSAWIGKRWGDPAFPKAFPHYGSLRYWQDQFMDLREQLTILQEPT